MLRKTCQLREKFCPGKNRSGGDGRVTLSLRPLNEFNLLSFAHQRVPHKPLIPKLIGDGQPALDLIEDVFQDAGMAPR